MEARAIARHVRISPTKVRHVVDLIRGKRVEDAEAMLTLMPQNASKIVLKVVRSAAANAETNLELDRSALFISEAYVDQGPTLKRIRPRARGRADRIKKRTSHITVVVAESGD